MDNEFVSNDPALLALFGEDLERQSKARQMNEAERREFMTALKDLLAEEKGQRFVWWLLEQTHLFQTSFTGNSATFFMEGERNVGLKVFAACMEADPGFMQRLVDFSRGCRAKTVHD